MRKTTKFALCLVVLLCLVLSPKMAYAWGDSDGGRPSYTTDEVNNGALGETITFNSISDNPALGGDEKNFVGARRVDSDSNVWNANTIAAEDGERYYICMYVHNDNPGGKNAVAKDTTVRFDITEGSGTEVEVQGFITSSNASPAEYYDSVRFTSDTTFHLEYMSGSAFIENNEIAAGSGMGLSDEIVETETGVLIGYDVLDGNFPGGYPYVAYVGIEVKVALNLNENGEVEIPKEQIIGTASTLFGDKVYADVEDQLAAAVEEIQKNVEMTPNPKKDELKELRDRFAKPIADTLIDSAKEQYGRDLRKSTQNQLERKIQETTETVVNREYGDYVIRDNQLIKECNDRIYEAQNSGASMAEITKIDEEYSAKRMQGYRDMVDNIKEKLHSDETVKKAAETIVETVETEKLKAEKDSIEGNVRDHLRGFSRTIPAFLMAYGDENTTLANFDALVPEDVFWEVTVNPQNGQGVTLDQFRMLRDGGDYTTESGEKKHFDGHLFDEVVFNDAVQEFMKKRAELANYFEPNQKGDIFDFIPPQRTNQIFTPKKVVKDMVDKLEQENPGCFDAPDATFADLYMKSGMYITEIVTRLYQSPRIKALYPDNAERLNHIFAKQVYGCAPTEIIYRICLRYILGFSTEIHIVKNNIRLCDTLEYAKNGTLEAEMRKLFFS